MDEDGHDDFTAYASGRWASLVRAAVLLGCSHADAEDAAQAALVKTWAHWGRVRQAGSMRSCDARWLCADTPILSLAPSSTTTVDLTRFNRFLAR